MAYLIDPSAKKTALEARNAFLDAFPLTLGALLAVVGGFLDAYTYIDKGQVFANAMTGNVVLLGVSTALHDWNQASKHLMPIFAFAAGVAAAETVKRTQLHHPVHWPATSCLVTETVVLFILGSLPNDYPEYLFTLSISFIAAFQSSLFSKIEKQPINTVMTTGNLRSFFQTLMSMLFLWPRLQFDSRLRIFGTVCVAFFLGALFGGTVTPWAHNRALWFAGGLLLMICITLIIRLAAAGRTRPI
jgi:uncharacterized membrane protein YoaK (UPF0700 family)